MPAEIPWLGTVLLPGFTMLAGSDASWLSEFEQAMAQGDLRASCPQMDAGVSPADIRTPMANEDLLVRD